MTVGIILAIIFVAAVSVVAAGIILRKAVESAREDERAKYLVDKFEHDAIDEAEKKRRQIAADLAADDAKIDDMKHEELERKINE